MRPVFIFLATAVLSLPLFAQNPPTVVRIDSKVMNEARQILVQVPRSYRTGARSYPVLYMTDGDAHIGHTSTTAEFLSRNGRMPEVIIVGISNTDRTRDLTPTNVPTQAFGGEQAFQAPTSGGADRFLQFIETEVIPYVEKNYRTQPYRIFAGHSFGGLFALHTLFTRPKLFNAWIAVSPSMGWDRNLPNRRAAEFVKENRELNGIIVVTGGEEGPQLDEEIQKFAKLIRARGPKGFEIVTQKLGDEDHGSVVLPSHYFGLRKIFDSWRFRLDPNVDPRRLPQQVRDHYARLSQRVGYSLPIPEGTMNIIGYRLMQTGNLREAIEVFEANVATHPQSANVYDSLGEAYERNGDLEGAKENYGRAVTIGKQTYDPNTPVFEANRARVMQALAKKK